jgi:hypothetical protein
MAVNDHGSEGGTTFWVANVLFFITGPVMVLVNQQLVYWGGADPEAFAGGFFQYAGFLVCQTVCTCCWLLTRDTSCESGVVNEFRWFPAGLKWSLVKLVIPVALFDAGDKWFQLFGTNGRGRRSHSTVSVSPPIMMLHMHESAAKLNDSTVLVQASRTRAAASTSSSSRASRSGPR